MFKAHFSKQRSRVRGAALVEFALVIPLILLLTFGILEYGRTLSELTWASNAAYHAVVLGAESSADLGPAAMNERVDSLKKGQNPDTVDLQMSPNFDIGEGTVKMALHGDVSQSGVGFANLSYTSDIVGPWFAALSSDIGDLNQFPAAPPPNDQFGCDGVKGSGVTGCVTHIAILANGAIGPDSSGGEGVGRPPGPSLGLVD